MARKQDLPFLNELRSRQDVFVVDLDRPFGHTGCVIMASGMGKRYGELAMIPRRVLLYCSSMDLF